MNDYLELTKPRITWFILMSAGVGYFYGLASEGRHPDLAQWWALFHLLVGTCLIASGTATLNQWYERLSDAQMVRTQRRPIPSGRVPPARAFGFGVLLAIVGFSDLVFGVNLLAGLLGLFTLASYLFVYTPLKRRSWHATTIGAIPGAMPPLIGYAAAHGTLTAQAWALFAILFVWQFPHFYAIAWMHRDDYARAGIQMLPVVEPDGASTARQILLYSFLMIPVSLLPVVLSMCGVLYLVGAAMLGALFLVASFRVFQELTILRARGVLLASIVYLPMLYCLLVLDRT